MKTRYFVADFGGESSHLGRTLIRGECSPPAGGGTPHGEQGEGPGPHGLRGLLGQGPHSPRGRCGLHGRGPGTHDGAQTTEGSRLRGRPGAPQPARAGRPTRTRGNGVSRGHRVTCYTQAHRRSCPLVPSRGVRHGTLRGPLSEAPSLRQRPPGWTRDRCRANALCSPGGRLGAAQLWAAPRRRSLHGPFTCPANPGTRP